MSKKMWLVVGGGVVALAVISVFGSSWSSRSMLQGVIDTFNYKMSPGYSEPYYGGTPAPMQAMPLYETRDVYAEPYYPPYDDGLSVDQRQYQVYANFGVVVPDVTAYLQSLRESFLAVDGRVLEMSSNSYNGMQSGSMTAKIPVASFDQAVSTTTQGVDKVVNQSMSASDVTGIKVSLESQITALEDQRAQREIDLLEAKTDAEKRRIQLDITRLQSQIDSLKAQLENQQEQVQYATLSVMAASSERYFDASIPPTFRETWDAAVASLLKNLMVILQFAIWVVVYAVVLVPLVWAVGKLRHRSRKQVEPIKPAE